MKEIATELMGICRIFGAFEKGAVCCGDITLPQCVVLQELHEGERDISALTTHTGASQSAVTRLVDGLERRGWVVRARPEGDRRRVIVTLTPAGQKQARLLRDLTERAVEIVIERIPRGKRRQVLESMRLVRQALAETRDSIWSCCYQ